VEQCFSTSWLNSKTCIFLRFELLLDSENQISTERRKKKEAKCELERRRGGEEKKDFRIAAMKPLYGFSFLGLTFPVTSCLDETLPHLQARRKPPRKL
jgi:hypothetical protein